MPNVNSHIDPVLVAYEGKTIPRGSAQAKAKVGVMDDPEAVEECVDETLSRRIKSRAMSHTRAMAGRERRQFSFLGELWEMYPVDLEEKVMKDTDDLSEDEYLQALGVRRKKHAELGAHIDIMQAAYDALRPIWREFPQATFGEAERIFLARASGKDTKPPPPREPDGPHPIT